MLHRIYQLDKQLDNNNIKKTLMAFKYIRYGREKQIAALLVQAEY